MRSCMKVIGTILQAQHFKFTPGSWRPGGATDLYLNGIPVNNIRFSGGWSSIVSLEHYIQEASSYRAFASLSSGSTAAIASVRSAFPVLPPPPRCAWVDLLATSSHESFTQCFRPSEPETSPDQDRSAQRQSDYGLTYGRDKQGSCPCPCCKTQRR